MRILMKLLFCTFLIYFLINPSFGQTSLKEIDLQRGPYAVGFQHYLASDSTRTYARIYDYTNRTIPRPISISMWYPSDQKITAEKPLSILNYFEILKEEEEWENLPNELILNWFTYTNTPENQEHLTEKSSAYPNINFAEGQFPVIVYAPSFQASSIENFELCEFLASHGYLVISSTSRGSENRWFSTNSLKELETQARDIEFLMKEVAKFPSDSEKIALMSFSFGGLSSVITQMRNANVKAVVSLDGTERYQYSLLSNAPFFELAKFDVPYLHMAQKDIPEKVLEEDKINPELNTSFIFYDRISKSKAYQLKFHMLSHSYFSTLGVLFENRDQRQDKSDAEIMKSYKLASKYTLNFFNAYLKNDQAALAFVEKSPSTNGIESELLSHKSKNPEAHVFTFQDFNELASAQNYENLDALVDSLLIQNPSLKLPEGNLNTLGLQLVFNSTAPSRGISVFLLATKIYPGSSNLFDSLGEAYLYTGNRDMAIQSFEKSLTLNSQNQNAIDRLDQLRR